MMKSHYSFHSYPPDDESPVISGCPSDVSGNTDGGIATGTISWTAPTATDNSGTQTLTSTHNPGDSFPIGTTTVTYTATDAAGNTANCSFEVVVAGKLLLIKLAREPRTSLVTWDTVFQVIESLEIQVEAKSI